MTHSPVIVWFRNDLRLADHPALAAALAMNVPVIPLFVLDDDTPGAWRPAGASRWWLAGSLKALDQSLRAHGSRLILRRGRAEAAIADLDRETGAQAVFLTRRYEPFAAREEERTRRHLAQTGVFCRRFGGALLIEPDTIATGAGDPYKVYTPFANAAFQAIRDTRPLPAPARIPAPDTWPSSEKLADWHLRPARPDWAGGLRKAWEPGESGAQERLNAFLYESAGDYGTGRDRPGRKGTSRLSPHLHFGEISPRAVWHLTRTAMDAGALNAPAGTAFLKELLWREFSHHLLYHWPDLPDRAWRAEFRGFPWREDDAALAAWQQARTGFPIVDAGMRELWHTGWMHNRVRMIAASFLVKDQLLPWQAGEAWFWDTLVDADLANNAASWQWVAGSGADASPYFRIFNPVLQGRKFDADGAYVRRWVPEIAALPDKYLHAPWEAPDTVLSSCGIALGQTYPAPVVDHGAARKRALAALKSIKAEAS